MEVNKTCLVGPQQSIFKVQELRFLGSLQEVARSVWQQVVFQGLFKAGRGARESGQLMPEAYAVENMCREKGGMRKQVSRTLGSE